MTTQQLPQRQQPPEVGERERIAVRQEFVLDAKISGFRPPQIHEMWNRRCEKQNRPELMVSLSTIQGDVRQILQRISEREALKAEQLRELLTARYESGLVSIAGQVRNGNLRAVEVMIKLNKAIAEVNGLTVALPTIEQHNTNVIMLSPDERKARVQQILDQVAERAMLLREHDPAVIDAEES